MKRTTKVFASIALVVTMLLSLTGCGEIKKAEKTVDDVFTAIKAVDFEELQNYLDLEDFDGAEGLEEAKAFLDEGKDALTTIFDKLDYNIIDSELVDPNTVNVKTEITAVDMKPILGDFFAKAMQYAFAMAFTDPEPTEEEIASEMTTIFSECIEESELQTVTNEVVIKVVNGEDGWNIDADEAFADALLGGLMSAIEELGSSFGGID